MVKTTRSEVQPIEIVRGVGDEVVVCVLDETRLHCALLNKVEVGPNDDRDRSLRMGKLNFDIDEAFLLKTYGLSTLAPSWVSLVVRRPAVAECKLIGNGKISIMSWRSLSEGPQFLIVTPLIRLALEGHQSTCITSCI